MFLKFRMTKRGPGNGLPLKRWQTIVWNNETMITQFIEPCVRHKVLIIEVYYSCQLPPNDNILQYANRARVKHPAPVRGWNYKD